MTSILDTLAFDLRRRRFARSSTARVDESIPPSDAELADVRNVLSSLRAQADNPGVVEAMAVFHADGCWTAADNSIWPGLLTAAINHILSEE